MARTAACSAAQGFFFSALGGFARLPFFMFARGGALAFFFGGLPHALSYFFG